MYIYPHLGQHIDEVSGLVLLELIVEALLELGLGQVDRDVDRSLTR